MTSITKQRARPHNKEKPVLLVTGASRGDHRIGSKPKLPWDKCPLILSWGAQRQSVLGSPLSACSVQGRKVLVRPCFVDITRHRVDSSRYEVCTMLVSAGGFFICVQSSFDHGSERELRLLSCGHDKGRVSTFARGACLQTLPLCPSRRRHGRNGIDGAQGATVFCVPRTFGDATTFSVGSQEGMPGLPRCTSK